MKRTSFGFVLCVFVFSVANVLAQPQENSGLIKTADGVLVVSNEPGSFYTLEIKGKSIKPIPDRPFWFTVDGKFLQVVNAEKAQFLKDAADKRLDDKAILSAHRKWESDYISETLGAKLNINSEWLKLSNGMTAIAWNYDMPHVADKQTAKRQLYLIVVKGDRVIGLNTVVEEDGQDKILQQFLIDTMNTFKPRDAPLNLERARELVLKGR